MLSRKPKPKGWVEPMPKKQFRRIEKAFNKNNGIFIMGAEVDAFLSVHGAEASTFNEHTIMFAKNPSRAAVFEELIHTAQYRDGKCDGSYESRIRNEIEAKEKLIKYSYVYKLTEVEVLSTKQMLNECKEELERLGKERK